MPRPAGKSRANVRAKRREKQDRISQAQASGSSTPSSSSTSTPPSERAVRDELEDRSREHDVVQEMIPEHTSEAVPSEKSETSSTVEQSTLAINEQDISESSLPFGADDPVESIDCTQKRDAMDQSKVDQATKQLETSLRISDPFPNSGTMQEESELQVKEQTRGRLERSEKCETMTDQDAPIEEQPPSSSEESKQTSAPEVQIQGLRTRAPHKNRSEHMTQDQTTSQNVDSIQRSALGTASATLAGTAHPEKAGAKVTATSRIAALPRTLQRRFAPLRYPAHRRLQTWTVAAWELLLPASLALFFLLASVPIFWPLLIPYLLWAICVDTAPQTGARSSHWCRSLRIWKLFAGYYPISLIKEANLSREKRYVFGSHPHGIISMGAFASFATDALDFSKLFPGLDPHLLILQSNFYVPLHRDVLLLHGVGAVSKKSCQTILRRGPGQVICIVVGGAAESLMAHPGTNDLVLKGRLGFIKVAVKEGADLVPVFSFGENDIFSQLQNTKGTKIYNIQKRFQAIFGFTLPIFFGRGIWNYSLGLLPYRHPIVTVVGRPIEVKQSSNPTTAELEMYQQRYITELIRIWEKYRDVYAANRTKELTILEAH